MSSFDEKLVSALRGGPLGLSELVGETGFARQTVHNHLQSLVERGLVVKETLPGGRGRPKVSYRLTPGLPRDPSTTKMVGLSDRADHRLGELSGGEQQRVSIARALANHPSLILVDEPTGDLDTKTRQEVIGRLKDLCKEEGVTVIMVTHDPIAAEYADRLIHMRDGKIEGERVLASRQV